MVPARSREPSSAEATVARARARKAATRGIVNQEVGRVAPTARGSESKISPVLPTIPRQIDRDPGEGYWNTPGGGSEQTR